MKKSSRDDNLAQEDDFIDESGEWQDTVTDNINPERSKTAVRGTPKWKAIEDYWEQKRLRDALQDYLSDDE